MQEANLCPTVAKNVLRELLVSLGLDTVSELTLTRR